MNKLVRFVVVAVPLCVLAGCNIYAPFNTDSTPTDYLEEATKCLDNDNFACAIQNYNMLPDGALKDEKLCTGYLAEAGLTLDVLLNIILKGVSQTVLGSVANAVLPWSASQGSDASNAMTHCVAFATESPSDPNAPLLQAMGYIMDCAVLMAKTDVYVGSSDTDTTCMTPGLGAGQITKQSIVNSNGNLMCSADAVTCGNDLYAIAQPEFATALSNNGLSNLANVFGYFSAFQTLNNATGIAARTLLLQTVPN
jgi:hypothetical protein